MKDNPPPPNWLATASEKAAARGPLGLGALAIALGFVAFLTGAAAITIAAVALLLVAAAAVVIVSARMDKTSHNDQPAQHNPEISAPSQQQQDGPTLPVEAAKSESEQRPNDED